MVKKLFIISIIFCFIFPSYGKDNFIELKKLNGNQNYSFIGYYLDQGIFTIGLIDNPTHKEIYYQFKNNKLFEIENKNLEEENAITRDYYDSWKMLRENVFPDNEMIKKYCKGGLKYNDKEYIICLEKKYQEEELFIFDGDKFNKIEMGNIFVEVGYGETFLFYDKQYNKLYFTGYKRKPKSLESFDNGLYVYDFVAKNTRLLQKVEESSRLIAPYRIPGTEKLIYLKNIIFEGKGIKRIYMRDIEK